MPYSRPGLARYALRLLQSQTHLGDIGSFTIQNSEDSARNVDEGQGEEDKQYYSYKSLEKDRLFSAWSGELPLLAVLLQIEGCLHLPACSTE